jgi:hypothetical protein
VSLTRSYSGRNQEFRNKPHYAIFLFLSAAQVKAKAFGQQIPVVATGAPRLTHRRSERLVFE